MEDDNLAERTPLSPDRLTEILDMCLRSTYFSYGDEFYEQREGAAMGLPASAVVANHIIWSSLRSWLSSQHLGPGCGSGMWMAHATSLGKVTCMDSYIT